MSGRMICHPSSAGKMIKHTEAFKRGIARLSFVVPSSAKVLKVNVKVVSGGKSAGKVSTFRVTGGALPTLSIADASVTEGNAGTSTLSFPVTLSAKSTDVVSVDYATADGTATTPADYAAASGSLTFSPGETAKTIPVTVVGDSAYEPDETLTVTLSKPAAATVTDGSATGTITNDDAAIRTGHYAGTTSQGKPVSFDVSTDVKTLSNGKFGFDLNCTEIQGFTVTDTFDMPPLDINPDWSFAGTGSYKDSTGSIVVEFGGKLIAPGSASGTLRVALELYGIPGIGTLHCQTGATPVTWNAS